MPKTMIFFIIILVGLLTYPSIAYAECSKHYCDYIGSIPNYVYSSTYTCGIYFIGERFSGCGRTITYRDFLLRGVYDEPGNHFHKMQCPYCGEFTYIFITKKSSNFLPGGSCFIATAASRTPFSKEVEILRKFRDSYIIMNPAGLLLSNFYYKISPPIAYFIAKSEKGVHLQESCFTQ